MRVDTSRCFAVKGAEEWAFLAGSRARGFGIFLGWKMLQHACGLMECSRRKAGIDDTRGMGDRRCKGWVPVGEEGAGFTWDRDTLSRVMGGEAEREVPGLGLPASSLGPTTDKP